MRTQTNISVVKSCCLFSCGECMAQSCSVDGCVCSIHLATHPHFPKGHCSCCFVIFRRVFSLTNEIEGEEATTVQPNTGSAQLGYASTSVCITRRHSVTHQGKLNSGDIPLEKTSDRKTGSIRALAKTRTRIQMSHEIFFLNQKAYVI